MGRCQGGLERVAGRRVVPAQGEAQAKVLGREGACEGGIERRTVCLWSKQVVEGSGAGRGHVKTSYHKNNRRPSKCVYQSRTNVKVSETSTLGGPYPPIHTVALHLGLRAQKVSLKNCKILSKYPKASIIYLFIHLFILQLFPVHTMYQALPLGHCPYRTYTQGREIRQGTAATLSAILPRAPDTPVPPCTQPSSTQHWYERSGD